MASSPYRIAKFTYAQDRPLYRFEKPYNMLSDVQNSAVKTNLLTELGDPEVVYDIRGKEDLYTLDNNGFCFRKHDTKFNGWNWPPSVEEVYFGEIKEILRREVDGADEIEIFDWRLRHSEGKPSTNLNDPRQPLQPSTQVHVDQSPSGVLKRARLLMGDRTERLLQGRVRIINVWRPLKPVHNWPLALCDGSSVHDEDFLEVDNIRKTYVGWTLFAKYRPGYKWYYLDGQTPEEVCIFKIFDSDQRVRARMCPHVSFQQDNAPPDAGPRESVEVRALVFTHSTAQETSCYFT